MLAFFVLQYTIKELVMQTLTKIYKTTLVKMLY